MMPTIKQTLLHIILGQKGGKNRIQIIELLNKRPYNPNQLAELLEVNYRTVKHHIEILLKNDLISTSSTGKYGDVYFLTPQMEAFMPEFNDIKKKFEYAKKLFDFTTTPQFFESVVEQTSDAVIIINNEWRVFFWNRSAVKLFGYKKDEVVGNIIQILNDIQSQESLIKKLEKGVLISEHETIGKKKNGSLIFIGFTAYPIKDESGNIIGFSIFCRNINKRKLAEKKLVQMSKVFKDSVVPIIIEDLEGNVIDMNNEAEKVYGWKLNELKGKPIKTIIPPERHKLADEMLKKCKKGEVVQDVETLRWTKSGNKFHVNVTLSLLKDELGKPIAAASIAEDITNFKMIQNSLKETNDIYKTILDIVHEPAVLINDEFKIELANRKFCDKFFLDNKKVKGKSIYDFTDGRWNSTKLRQLLEGVRKDNSSIQDFKIDAYHKEKENGQTDLFINAAKLVSKINNKAMIILTFQESINQQKR